MADKISPATYAPVMSATWNHLSAAHENKKQVAKANMGILR